MPSVGEDLDRVEGLLRARGIDCHRERFRLPSRPRLSPSAGLLLGSAGGFLLAAGRPTSSFLLAVAGATVLLLDAYGFSPLAWLGPRRTRSLLVVPGTPSEDRRKALFFGIPLRCRLTEAGHFSRGEALLRAAFAAGPALAFLLCAVSGGVLLVLLPPVPRFGGAAGTALFLLAAAAWAGPAPGDGPPNEAASWADRLAAREDPFRPFLLVYSGDAEEVKFFLARHRGSLLRGHGIFLEFPPGSFGRPAASVAEGPFLPYRVDPPLLSLVRQVGEAHGVSPVTTLPLRDKSAGLFAMARGFRAITLFRLESPPVPDAPFPAETALAWARGIADAFARGGVPDLTEGGKKG